MWTLVTRSLFGIVWKKPWTQCWNSKRQGSRASVGTRTLLGCSHGGNVATAQRYFGRVSKVEIPGVAAGIECWVWHWRCHTPRGGKSRSATDPMVRKSWTWSRRRKLAGIAGANAGVCRLVACGRRWKRLSSSRKVSIPPHAAWGKTDVSSRCFSFRSWTKDTGHSRQCFCRICNTLEHDCKRSGRVASIV